MHLSTQHLLLLSNILISTASSAFTRPRSHAHYHAALHPRCDENESTSGAESVFNDCKGAPTVASTSASTSKTALASTSAPTSTSTRALASSLTWKPALNSTISSQSTVWVTITDYTTVWVPPPASSSPSTPSLTAEPGNLEPESYSDDETSSTTSRRRKKKKKPRPTKRPRKSRTRSRRPRKSRTRSRRPRKSRTRSRRRSRRPKMPKTKSANAEADSTVFLTSTTTTTSTSTTTAKEHGGTGLPSPTPPPSPALVSLSSTSRPFPPPHTHSKTVPAPASPTSAIEELHDKEESSARVKRDAKPSAPASERPSATATLIKKIMDQEQWFSVYPVWTQRMTTTRTTKGWGGSSAVAPEEEAEFENGEMWAGDGIVR